MNTLNSASSVVIGIAGALFLSSYDDNRTGQIIAEDTNRPRVIVTTDGEILLLVHNTTGMVINGLVMTGWNQL